MFDAQLDSCANFMKTEFLSAALICGLLNSCAQKADHKQAEGESLRTDNKLTTTKKEYVGNLTANSAMSFIFSDYDTDSATTKYRDGSELNTGAVDTSWFWIPKNANSLKERYQGGLQATQISSKKIEYIINNFRQFDSVAVLLYEISNDIDYGPNAEHRVDYLGVDMAKMYSSARKTGLAIFCKTSKGWSLKSNDFNFYKHFDANQQVLRVENAGEVASKPAILFISESVGQDHPAKRQTVMLDYSNQVISNSLKPIYEISDRQYGLYSHALTLKTDDNAVSTINSELLNGEADRIMYILDASGRIVGLKFYKLSLKKGESPIDVSRLGSAKLLLRGDVTEEYFSARYPNSSNANDNAIREEHLPVLFMQGAWKNYVTSNTTQYNHTQLPAFQRYSLVHSKPQGLPEGSFALPEDANDPEDAARFRQNLDHELQYMKAQAQKRMAQEEVNRVLRRCNYCNGKGCLQCGKF